jgi:filamentous hemagglutinin family protein
MSGPKSSFSRREERRRRARWGRFRRWGLGAAALGLPFAVLPADQADAQALPTGGNVVGGSGTISQTSANQLTINQNSSTLSIDWQNFSVGAGNIVRFIQPDSSSLALNRVIGPDPSLIFGSIQANGRVVIMNPAGIYFGPSAMVDVNGLVATTSRMNQADFLAGNLNFSIAGDVNARVINEGFVNVAQGGFAVLSAAAVENKGTIVAQGGTVVLAGTPTFTLDFFGDGLLKFASTGTVTQAPTGANALVENSGTVQANGGRVLMTARAARDVINNVINVTGIVEARSARVENGEIVIDGGENGIVSVDATLDVSGTAADAKGGTIKVLGEKVGLFENARLDASGDAGGGTVLVGGNYQGKGPEANAKMVYMDARAVIDASSALADGGRVILWSDEATRNAGHIDVSGAVNGGFIEVSSKGFLDFRGTVGLRGTSGNAGTLLLDPTDITISGSASSGDMSAGSPFSGTNASSNLYVATLNTALNGGTVIVSTNSAAGGTGFIDITTGITNSAANSTLVLQADGAITITGAGSINSGGYLLNVVFQAASGISIGGAISTSGGNITTTGYSGTGKAAGNLSTTANINTGGGLLNVNQTGSVNFGANVTVGGGTGIVTLNADGAVTQSAGSFNAGGDLVIGGTGAVTLAQAGNNLLNITLNRTGTSNSVTLYNNITGNIQTSTLGTGGFAYTSATAGFTQSGAITQDAGATGIVSINGGSGTVTLSQANSWSGDLSVGASNITVSAAQTFTNTVSKSANFVQNGVGVLTISGNIVATSGSLALVATSGGGQVSIGSAITTLGGNIQIYGNAPGGVPSAGTSAGNYKGVWIDTGSNIDAGGGNIDIAGRGGNNDYNYGVYITGAQVKTIGTGTLTIAGLGGTGGSTDLAGVVINASSLVRTQNGALSIDGTGAAGSSGSNYGVHVGGASSVTTTSNGAIAITGTGGSYANGDSIYFGGSTLSTSGTGGITLTGNAPAGTGHGVNIAAGSAISLTGTGAITISSAKNVVVGANLTTATGDILIKANVASWSDPANGTPTFAANSGDFKGVHILPSVLVSTSGGSIYIAGKGGTSASNNGVLVDQGDVNAGGGGDVRIFGAGTASNAHGIEVFNGGVVAGGALTMVGGDGAGGDANWFGIALNTATVSAGGDISLEGRGGANGSGTGFYLLNGSTVSSTGGSVTITGETAYAASNGVNLAGGSVSATGSGAITISSGKNVAIAANVTSNTGDIAIMGNVASWTGDKSVNDPTFGTTTGDFKGVSISGGADITSMNGDIFIAGHGGTTGLNQYGVSAAASSVISTTSAGKIIIHGEAGASASNNYGDGGSHTGIYLNGAAPGTAVDITTQNGLIRLVGNGDQSGGATDNNGGVALQWAKVRATGTGSIEITGTSASVGTGRGVYIGLTGSEVTTASGNVTITGTGGGSVVASDPSFYSAGVEIAANGIVRSTGVGNVTLVGIAGSAGAGIHFSGSSATVGDAAMTGNVALRTNSVVNTATTLSLLGTSGGTIGFTGETDGATIGVNVVSETANFSAGLLSWISGFGTLQFGSSTQTGNILVGSTAFSKNLTLRTQGAIAANAMTMGAFNLFVIADGGFTQSAGSITTSGTATFFGPGNVTAMNAGNSFGILEISKSGSSANVNIATPGAGFNLGAVDMGTGTLTLSADRMTVTGSVATSGGAISMTADRYINVSQNINTQGGNITMSANAAGTGGGEDFAGVFVNGVAVQSRGGNINITGKGSAYGGTVSGQHGIFLYNGGAVRSYTGGGDGTTGTITLTGVGGTFAGGDNGGVTLVGAASTISSRDGNITINATGGTGASGGNAGLYVGGGAIRTDGAGTITVTATGGQGNASRGIAVTGNAGAYGRIETMGSGSVNLTGTGGGTAGNNVGVYVYDGLASGSDYGLIRASGTGNLSITGTGGAAAGASNIGIAVQNTNSAILTNSGTLTLNGTATSSGSDPHGVYLALGGAVSSASGAVSIAGNSTNGSGIALGAATVATGGAGTLIIGGTSTNQSGFVVTGPATFTTASGAMTLTSNNGLDLTNAVLVSGGGLTLTGGAGAIAANNAVNLITGTITFTNSAGNVSLSNGTGYAVGLGASTAAGGLTVVSGAGITQSGALTVGGNASFTAGAAAIDLATNGTGNSFGGTVSLTSSGGNVSIAAAGDLTLASVAMDGNLTATASGIITLSGGLTMTATPGRSVTMTSTGVLAGINIEGAITLNNGSVTLASDNWISIDYGISTGGGNILMDATGIYSGTYVGVSIVNNAVIDAGGGNIAIDGTGGNIGAGQHGVTMDGSTLTTSGTGTISVTGQGGPSTGGGSHGVYLQGGADIHTVDGALTIDGTGSTIGGFVNNGIKIAGSTIRTTGSGSIGITGNGGVYGPGFYLAGTNAAVRTVNGNINVAGNGTNDQSGVVMINDAGTGVIESTGTGNVSVTGTGGTDPSSTVFGIRLFDAVSISSNSGTLTLTGTGGSGNGGGADGINVGTGATVSSGSGLLTLNGTGGAFVGDGVKVASGGAVTANAGNIVMNGESTGGYGIAIAGDIGDGGMSGDITLISDTFNITTATASIWTTGGVTIKPLLGVGIGIGGGVGTLQLGNDFTYILANSLHIGSATTQTVEVGAGGLLGASNVPVYLEGSDIALFGNVDVLGGKVTLHAHSGGVAQSSGSNITAQTVILRGAGTFDLTQGAGAGFNDFEQLAANVTGALSVRMMGNGYADAVSATDTTGTVAGITTSGNLIWEAHDTIGQLSGGLVNVGGTTALSSATGSITLYEPGNNFGTSLTASGGAGIMSLRANSIQVGVGGITSGGDLILATTSGGITQSGAVAAAGNFVASALGGSIALGGFTNAVSGTTALTASGGKQSIAWAQSGPMVASNVSATGYLIIDVTGGSISQVGAMSAGDPSSISVTGGNIALTNASNAFGGALTLTATGGSIAITSSGALTLGPTTASNGLMVTAGGTLSQSGPIVLTGGSSTLSATGTMTLTDSSNNFGSALALTGVGGDIQGTAPLASAVTAVGNGFAFNSTAIANSSGGGGGGSQAEAITTVTTETLAQIITQILTSTATQSSSSTATTDATTVNPVSPAAVQAMLIAILAEAAGPAGGGTGGGEQGGGETSGTPQTGGIGTGGAPSGTPAVTANAGTFGAGTTITINTSGGAVQSITVTPVGGGAPVTILPGLLNLAPPAIPTATVTGTPGISGNFPLSWRQ